MALPQFLQTCLWSYDLTKMDKNQDRRLIITQVINYGDGRQLSWLKANYSLTEIEEVVTHPQRGVWWREKLRHWLGVFGLMLDPLEFEVAIKDINIRPKLTEAYFRRKGMWI